MSDENRVPCSNDQILRFASRFARPGFVPCTAEEAKRELQMNSERCNNTNVWNAIIEFFKAGHASKKYILTGPDVNALTRDERDSDGALPTIAALGLTSKAFEKHLIATGCCVKEDFDKSAWTINGKRPAFSRVAKTGMVLDLSKI
jgi:hypothetical protein